MIELNSLTIFFIPYFTLDIVDKVNPKWSNVVKRVYIQGPPGQEREVENITWDTWPLYPNCQTFDLLANPYFDESKPSNEITFMLPISKGFHDFTVKIQERNKLLKRRPLKSSMLAYNGPEITVSSLSQSSSFEVALKMSQFIYLETDTERNCRNYPSREFESYRACDEHFVQKELARDFGLAPFWATGNLSGITKKK